MELLMFYQPDCPYCRMAEEALRDLRAENEAYRAVPLRRVNELAERELADKYDYWNVPCFFWDGQKLFEAKPGISPAAMRAAVEGALRAAAE